MLEFLSEENLNLHKEYYRNLKHKWSILEKSIPVFKAKDLSELYMVHASKDAKNEAICLKREIYLHETYFSSFIKSEEKRNPQNAKIKSQFGSINNFLFEAYMYARKLEGGFFIIFEEKKRLKFASDSLYKLPHAICALDLCEHAYFLDYRFEKDEYIKSALAYLNENKFV